MPDPGYVALQLLALLPFAVAILLIILGYHWIARSEREANERAELVVRSILSAEEYQQLESLGYLDVPSPGHPFRVYRVPQGAGMVTVLEGGSCVERLCLQSTAPIPERETVLIHKLMIEGNEQVYLQTANHFPCLY